MPRARRRSPGRSSSATGSYDLGAKAERLERPSEWTPEKIIEKARTLTGDKGPAGNFED